MADYSQIWNAVSSVAPLAGAALNVIGSPVAANQAAGGYKQAANTVGNAINTSGTSLQPFQTGGVGANTQLQSLFGLNGQPANDAAISAFENTPGFKFQEEQGDQAIQRAANAQGNGFSSTTLASLGQYNAGLAASTYQDYVRNLFGLNTSGENAAVARGSQAIQGANYQGGFQANRGMQVANGISGAASGMPGVMSALPGAINGIRALFGNNSGGNGSDSASGPYGGTSGTWGDPSQYSGTTDANGVPYFLSADPSAPAVADNSGAPPYFLSNDPLNPNP